MPHEKDMDSLMERLRQYKDYYDSWRQEAEKAEEFYEGEFAITRPKGVRPIIPPTARRAIELATTELITDAATVHRRRDDHSEKQRGWDDKIERGFQNWLLDQEEYHQTPVLHDAGKMLLRRGVTFFAGPFFNATTGEIWTEAYDPLLVFIEPGPEPREAFIDAEMTVAEWEQTLEKYGPEATFDRKDRSPISIIRAIQWYHYDRGQPFCEYAAWVEGDQEFAVGPRRLAYPYLPIDAVASGWGSKALGSDPKQQWVSLIDAGVRDLLVAEAEMFTILSAYGRQVVWNRYRLPPNVALPEKFAIEIEPNSITFNVPEQLVPFDVTPLPREVSDHFERVRFLVGEFLFQPILAGQRQPNVGTATGLALLSTRARRKFNPPIRLLQAGVSRLLARLGKLLVNIDAITRSRNTFTWRGADVSSFMFDEDFSMEVDLSVRDDEERRLLITQGISLDGKIPQRMQWEVFYGIENYTAARNEWLQDRFLAGEAFMNDIAMEYTAQVEAAKAEKTGKQGDRAAEAGKQNQPSSLRQLAEAFRVNRTGFPGRQPETVEGLSARADELGIPRF